jgi:hypothetical protein
MTCDTSSGVDLHCQLTLLFISGTSTYALTLRCVSKRLVFFQRGSLVGANPAMWMREQESNRVR